MVFVYYLYLLTFLFFPILAIILLRNRWIRTSKTIYIVLLGCFSLYTIFYSFGYSLKGDYPDFIAFSLAYLLFCLLIFRCYGKKGKLVAIVRTVGALCIVIGFVQALFGIVLFAKISNSFQADKIYSMTNDKQRYETRRYTFGFATLKDVHYNFSTYKMHAFLPIEKQVNQTAFSLKKSPINLESKAFNITMFQESSTVYLVFESDNNASFKVAIKD